MQEKYTVYWIRYDAHDDPFNEGYVGITKQLDQRMKEHRHNKILGSRLKKGAKFEVLYENLDKEEACKIEEKYRPIERIGWNVNRGGNIPPSQLGKSYEGQLRKGEDRTEAQKRASSIHSKRMKNNSNRPLRECELFGLKFSSLKEARQVLGLSISQVYYALNSDMKFESPQSLKDHIWNERNAKIKKSKMRLG